MFTYNYKLPLTISHIASYTNGITKEIVMPTIKTAISIDEKLFAEVTALSEKYKISKSQIFSQSVAYFINKNKNLDLLHKINAAFSHDLQTIDDEYLKKSEKNYRAIIDKW